MKKHESKEIIHEETESQSRPDAHSLCLPLLWKTESTSPTGFQYGLQPGQQGRAGGGGGTGEGFLSDLFPEQPTIHLMRKRKPFTSDASFKFWHSIWRLQQHGDPVWTWSSQTKPTIRAECECRSLPCIGTRRVFSGSPVTDWEPEGRVSSRPR